jgi:holo-[acyl-carrier protein] synthase
MSQSNRRWAVKEAAYKAVYPALKPTWKEFTLQKPTGSPKPELVYHPNDDSSLSLRLGRIHTSASHDRDYVFATVIVAQPAQI